MATLTADARLAVRRLTQHFLEKGRPEAAQRLAEAVERAKAQVDDPAVRWRPAPTPYPELAAEGFRWIRLHRYWVAFTVQPHGEGVIHRVLYDAADIPRRLRGPGPG